VAAAVDNGGVTTRVRRPTTLRALPEESVMSRSSKPTRIGADIGGTFTDLQILDARSGAIVSHEVATTPTDPSIGLMGGVAEAAARFGFALDDVGYLLHGTTTATNVVLERKFPSGALVATASLPALVAMAADLVAQGGARLAADGIAAADRTFAVSADLRYRGQAFELTVPWSFTHPDQAALDRLVADFHAAHRQRFSYANPDDAVEIVTLRLAAIGHLAPPERHAADRRVEASHAATRPVWTGGGWCDVPVLRRAALAPGISHVGPAIVEEDYTTALIVPGWNVAAEGDGHLVARRTGGTTFPSRA
jgi:N-methylhydantoinase A/oxoprolinase/acetone carboxylase beta subunit